MAHQYSQAVVNAKLDQIEVTIGTAPQLRFYTGAAPANCAAPASGSLLGTISLPSDWMAAASAGSKGKAGTWSGTYSAAGNVGHYRIYDSTGTVCHIQGSVTASGGGGDMTLDNIVAANGQAITVNSYTITGGNQ